MNCWGSHWHPSWWLGLMNERLDADANGSASIAAAKITANSGLNFIIGTSVKKLFFSLFELPVRLVKQVSAGYREHREYCEREFA